MSILDPLHGFRGKIVRAKKHLSELQGSINAVAGDADTYNVTKESHAENGVYAFRLNLLNDFPVTTWGLIVGDCVHNLRSALDHLFWTLLRLKHPGDLPTNHRKAQFPVYLSQERFFSEKAKIENWVGERAFVILERLQPYHSENPSDNLLFFLHDRNITDKHRLLIPSVGIVEKAEVTTTTIEGRPIPTVKARSFMQDALHHGVVLSTVVVDPPDSVKDVNIQVFKIGIFFDRGGGRTYPVTSALADAIEMVEEIGTLFVDFFPNQQNIP